MIYSLTIRSLVERVSKAFGINPSTGSDSAPFIFDEAGEARPAPFSVSLLPDFERVAQRQLEKSSQATCLSHDSRLLAVTRTWECICCGQLPSVDQAA